VNGQLHIGELPKGPRFWFSGTFGDDALPLVDKVPGWKKNASQNAWKAKLERMRRQKFKVEEDAIAA
jgi:hypothetical protein